MPITKVQAKNGGEMRVKCTVYLDDGDMTRLSRALVKFRNKYARGDNPQGTWWVFEEAE